ncbi:hypothetical protein DL96DRAFT_1681986 [Flagelloscypha sp. PMI_526]|nr:hypothetical protein DL96DRAFT_1681986 [Flagelloscypha sp. PMI_526]
MSSATSNTRAAALKVEGNAFFVKRDYHEAIAKYTDAIDIEPTAVLHANRAQCYLNLEMYMDASADGRRAVELDPEYSKGYVRFAMAEQKLGNLDKSIELWEMVLKTANRAQTADIEIALSKTRAEKEAQNDLPSLLSKVHIIPDEVLQQLPQNSVESIIPDLTNREEWFSSAFVVQLAEGEFQRAQHLMSLRKHDGEKVTGVYGAIEAFTNYYSEQAMIECQTHNAWFDEGPSDTKTAVMERLKGQSWDQVRPGLSLTIRCWIMKGWLMNSMETNPSAGLEYIQRAIDILEWGRVTFPSVPPETKGAVFRDTFTEPSGFSSCNVSCVSTWEPIAPIPDLEVFYEEVSEILKEITADIKKTRGERKLDTAGHILCFYDYHLAEAHALTGLYHTQLGHNLQLQGVAEEEYFAHYEKATIAYLYAAEAIPEDDEKHAWYLNASLANGSQCLVPVKFHIQTIKRMQRAIPKMEKIWKNSTLAAQGRDDTMKERMKPLEKLEEMLRDGNWTKDTMIRLE